MFMVQNNDNIHPETEKGGFPLYQQTPPNAQTPDWYLTSSRDVVSSLQSAPDGIVVFGAQGMGSTIL